MEIHWWQILLLSLYAGYQILDELQIYSSMSAPVFAGLFSGLVMGAITTCSCISRVSFRWRISRKRCWLFEW